MTGSDRALMIAFALVTIGYIHLTRRETMAAFEDMKADLDAIQASQADTDRDVDALLALAQGNTGGFTADQVAELQTTLTGIKDRSAATAAKFDSSTPTEPPVEPPVV